MQYLLLIVFFLGNFLNSQEKDSNNISSSSQEGIHYTVEWPKGLAPEIIKRIESVSVLLGNQSRLPGSIGGLMKRIEKDKTLLEKTLRSFGYYGCKIAVEMDVEAQPIIVKFTGDLGPLYVLERVELENIGEVALPTISVDLNDLVDLTKEDVLIAENAQKNKTILRKYFAQSGYPFAEIEEPEGIIDHSKHSIVLVYPVNAGKRAIIIGSEIETTERLNPEYIKNRLYWKNGDAYDNRIVERTRRKLSQTGLFDNILVTPKPIENGSTQTGPEQQIMMNVKAIEAAPKSVTAGVYYASSQGSEARFSWNNYNFAGGGENLGTALRVSTIRSKARLYYNIPDFGAPKQTLKNETYVMKENTRAYKSNTFSLASKLERQFDDVFSGSIGLSTENGSVTSKTTDQKKPDVLIGVPIEVGVDASNDLLNPTRGFRINGNVTPYGGHLGSSRGMIIAQAGASLYLPFHTNSLDEDMGVLASFVKFGTIRIRNFDDLPPNKRFYGGGNGSVRGYGYQLISPVDQNRIPLGGESLLEFGGELRYRFTETIGGVAFLEAGSVSQRKIFNSGQTLLWSTGVGVRYYTAYAPVRVDIAFPLKRRKIPGARKPYDRPYQFYVSVGQAF